MLIKPVPRQPASLAIHSKQITHTSMSAVQETTSPVVHEEPNTHDLHQGYVEMYHHGLVHVKSTALLCAVGLGIPGAIHRRGGAATLPHIATDTGVHPAKRSYLRRLMRVLTFSGVFNSHQPDEGNETLYTLTNVSRILVSDDTAASTPPCDVSAMLRLLARPSTSISTFFSLEEWFRDAGTATLFETALGVPTWGLTKNDASYNRALNDACFADSSFSMGIVLKDAKSANIFRGLGSLVDVGGGHGAAAMAIAKAFPHVKCSVLDLDQVISKAPDLDGTVKFIAGDMFEFIPPADAVFLKVRTFFLKKKEARCSISLRIIHGTIS